MGVGTLSTEDAARDGPGKTGVPALADLHTHMVPGVDDGAPDLDSALQALDDLWHDGVAAVVATPHLNASRPNGSRRQATDQAWPELKRAAAERLPDLELHRGFELLLDDPEVELDEAELRLAGTRFVLVEFHAFTIPHYSAPVLARIREAGYVPVLAHPERYWGYDREMEIVASWRRAGALMALNGGSIIGENGSSVATRAHRFLQNGWADVIASDNHARPPRLLSLRTIWDHMVDEGLEGHARLLLSENPRRILRDEMPAPVGTLPEKGGLFSRMMRAFMGARE